MLDYDRSLDLSVSGWEQRLAGLALAIATFGVAWIDAGAAWQALVHHSRMRYPLLFALSLPVLAWLCVVSARLLSGDYGRRELLPRWMFVALGVIFAIVAAVAAVGSFYGIPRLAGMAFGMGSLAVACIGFGLRTHER